MVYSITEVEFIKSIWADLNSGMDCLPDLVDIMTHIYLSLIKRVSFTGQLPETILQTLKSSTSDSLEVEHILLSMSPLISFFFWKHLQNQSWNQALWASLLSVCNWVCVEICIWTLTNFDKFEPYQPSPAHIWLLPSHISLYVDLLSPCGTHSPLLQPLTSIKYIHSFRVLVFIT